MVPRVHVHMTVSDLAKSTEFYTRFFGAAPVKTRAGYAKFLPDFGPLNLALSDHGPAEGRGHVDHMGIQVETRDEVLRQLARVKAAGLTVREEVGVDCCHANQDKFWATDPDGVEWEIYVLNYDLEDGTGCDTGVEHVAPAKNLGLLKAGSCCSPS